MKTTIPANNPEQQPGGAVGMNIPSLESVLCTEELERRPYRPPDFEAESGALVSLARELTERPGTILQALADTILRVLRCGSAGVSLVTEDGKRFRWPAIAGVWQPHIGGGTPRDFGPCGDVLDRDCPLLFRHLERRYAYFKPVTPPVEEALLVPIYAEGKAVGTIWAIQHDVPAAAPGSGSRVFDGEDLRMLVSLGTFASAAYQAVEQLHKLKEQTHENQGASQTLLAVNEALLVSSVRQHELAQQARKAEAAVRDSEVRYRRLFQSSKDGILILDATTGKIIDANAFMSGLLGQELPGLVGKELYEIGLFKDEAANKAAFTELQKNGYIRYDHLPVQKPTGETTHVEFVSNVYAEGERLLAQCNVRDITARAAMEREIEQQAAALAEQSRRKDEFLAMLSHELRNPLAPIRSAAHLLKLQEQGGATAVQTQAREIIERQVANLTKMVNDLMEVSRVVSGRIRLDLHPVDLKQVVEHATQTAATLFEQRGHSVSVGLCPESLGAVADAARLEEVLVNLLNNAAKYTPDGGRIQVSCERRLDRGVGGQAVIRVRDNGVGIDAELLPHIFDLFTQADRSLARSAGGLGIGLSLAHRLVELHGGTIEAHSEGAGKGSEFVVSLPLISAPVASAPQEPSPKAEALTSEAAGIDHGGARVLVVDDNTDLVMMLSSALRQKGYSVQSAHTGQEGLRIAQQWLPTVVLLDIGLPGLDGYEVARRLRSDPKLGGAGAGGAAEDANGGKSSRMRLIALTGYGQDADIALAREVGFDGHLIKPCDFDELERMMTAPGK